MRRRINNTLDIQNYNAQLNVLQYNALKTIAETEVKLTKSSSAAMRIFMYKAAYLKMKSIAQDAIK